jgi:hypothetical protein
LVVAEVQLVGRFTIVAKTRRTNATLRYEFGPLIYVDLYDKELKESFSFAIDDSPSSRDKLTALINQGAGADADYLRLLQKIRKPVTQGEYFAKLAKNELTLKELQRAVQLSRSKKFDRKTLREYRSRIISLVRPVLEAGRRWERIHVVYCKTPEHHVFLIFEGATLDGGSIFLKSAIFVSEFGVKALDPHIYIEYAIYRYLLGDRKQLERWLEKGPKYDLKTILDWLRQEEESGTLRVIDEELYAFLKSVISLQLIAC